MTPEELGQAGVQGLPGVPLRWSTLPVPMPVIDCVDEVGPVVPSVRIEQPREIEALLDSWRLM